MKCDIIIPVGPGHEEIVHRAAGSVEWAKKYDDGGFDIDIIGVNDTKGLMGRSKARNEGVKSSKADWVFFLDADDLMHPEAFAAAADHIPDCMPEIDALWGKIVEYKADGLLYERLQIPTIHNLEELISYDPYLTIQMGHFVKREIALENPFNEDMNTGEDWDYFLRVWKDHHCLKIREPLMCNVRGQNSTGPRSANGQDWRTSVEAQIEAAKNGE